MHSLRTAAQVTASLDQPVGEDATPLGELIADPRAVDPLHSAIEHEQHDDISAMLELLQKRHREVIAGRYGLDGHSVQSHEQIGGRLGVGKERPDRARIAPPPALDADETGARRLARGHHSRVLAARTAARQGLERLDDRFRGGDRVLRHDDVEPQEPRGTGSL